MEQIEMLQQRISNILKESTFEKFDDETKNNIINLLKQETTDFQIIHGNPLDQLFSVSVYVKFIRDEKFKTLNFIVKKGE